MTWFAIDDQYPEHPKVAGLSDASFRLDVSAKAYAARVLTDGLIPKAMAARLHPGGCPDELIAAGLWHDLDDPESWCGDPECTDGHAVTNGVGHGVSHNAKNAYLLHDYLAYNKSRAQVDSERDAARDRQRRHREAKKKAKTAKAKGSSKNVTPEQTGESQDSHAVTNGVSHGEVREPPTPTPVLPNGNTRPNTGSSIERRNEDAHRLCEKLATFVAEATETKRPTITKAWITDMERMIRIDEIEPDRIDRCLEWIFESADGSFWRPNIQSPSKLRKKFPQLSAQSRRKNDNQRGTTEEGLRRTMSIAEQAVTEVIGYDQPDVAQLTA